MRSGSILSRLLGKAALFAASLALLSVVVFASTLVLPGDPARIFLGKGATPEQIANFREENGLDKPIPKRYADWAVGMVQGDFGRSVLGQRPVSEVIPERLARSLALAAFGFLIAVPLSVAIGVFSGLRAGSRLDVTTSLALVGVASLPEFVIGVGLTAIFVVFLGLFPATVATDVLFGSFPDKLWACVLPALTLALIVTPHMARQVRGAVHEAINAPHVRAATLRGLPPRQVLRGHIAPTASGRVVNVFALDFAELLSGFVIVEVVFGFPGAGQLLVEAIAGEDAAVVQALVLITGGIYIAFNFAADAIVDVLNPRRRAGLET